jgi:hypothetical protein
VSAAAAVLLGLDPSLTSSQVSRILERHTDDVNAAEGCDECPDGRDKFSGWGRLDVTRAVKFLSSENPPPPSDRLEPNDRPSQARELWGKRPSLDATLDYWDDPVDVYRVKLERGQRLHARLAAGWANASVDLTLLRPAPKSGHGRSSVAARTAHPGRVQRLSYRAPRGGWYDLKLRTTSHSGGRYALDLTKSG